MPKLLFIEGVSGAGKTTPVRALEARLRARGHAVKSRVEFDFTNLLDFYAAAYVPRERYRDGAAPLFPAEPRAEGLSCHDFSFGGAT